MPFVGRAILLRQLIVDRLAHEEAEDEEDHQEAGETGDKGDDATDIDILDLVAWVFGIAHRRHRVVVASGGTLRVLSVVSISGHVQAPKALRYAGRSHG